MSIDAKGCYDRIAHIVVYICMVRLGASEITAQAVLKAIKGLKHYIKTAFGRSKDSYGGDPSNEPSGLLQGNGMAPPGWSTVATVLVNIMKAQGFGYQTWSLISQRAIEITCFQFVDDTDLIHSTTDNSKPTADLLIEAQAALSTWEGILRSTGGALAEDKSYWYLLEVIYKQGKWRYATSTDQPGELFLANGDKSTCKEAHQPSEALGIQIRPDGKND
jgi:hypothetical protein